jgi:hypothetical protein
MPFICILALLMPFGLLAQPDPVIYSVYCIGNTGRDTIPSPAIQLLAFESFDDSLSAVLILGDFSSHGISRNEESIRPAILQSQFSLFKAYRGNIWLLPGEAEWNGGRFNGRLVNENCMNLSNEWFRVHGIVPKQVSRLRHVESRPASCKTKKSD